MSAPTCPNCRDVVSSRIKTARMATCPSCNTTPVWRDHAFEKAGHAGEMHDAPMLFGVGDIVNFDRIDVVLHGHARFSYGRGWWDEFWGLDNREDEVWISIDEGDVVIQRPVPRNKWPKAHRDFSLGALVDFKGEECRITEEDMGEGSVQCECDLRVD